MRWNEFRVGMRAAVPVCMGYFSVAFGFGAMAVAQSLTIWQAVLISGSNLTSAGQFAGLTVIAGGAADHLISGVCALVVALVLALKKKSLIVVASAGCVVVFLVELLMRSVF